MRGHARGFIEDKKSIHSLTIGGAVEHFPIQES
jgi:hypothetical protein